ncbi:MAG: CvpA family protein [Desulfovermiculus sp.]|nr:CvpA family protein [Desulfovermiculus sp.]
MNGLDIVFALIIGLTLLRGLWRGAVQEVSSLVALIAGFVLAGRYASEAAAFVQQGVNNPQIAAGLGYLGLFFAVYLCVVLLGILLRKFLHAVLLGWVDRLGGGFLGLAKGLLISCLLLFILTIFISPRSGWVADSRLSPYLNVLTQKMIVLIPDGLKESFADKSRALHRIWEKDQV